MLTPTMIRNGTLIGIAITPGISCLFMFTLEAGLLPGKWWDEKWNCIIDGRPARMS